MSVERKMSVINGQRINSQGGRDGGRKENEGRATNAMNEEKGIHGNEIKKQER
jgi:hypothetical protein